jgi:hypothetical protein
MKISDEFHTRSGKMIFKKMPSFAATSSLTAPRTRFRALKIAVALVAGLYFVNGVGAAVGYVKALPPGTESSAQIVTRSLWVGAVWPVVMQDMMRADRWQRL